MRLVWSSWASGQTRGAAPRLWSIGCALLLAGALAPAARAGFIGAYACSNFTLTNSAEADGSATCPDDATLVITGPNNGSGLDGTTDLTMPSPASGVLQFDYIYTSLDPDPGYDYAGYLLGADFFQEADTSGQSGTVILPVLVGQIIGFRVGTFDNLGEPGVLTITNFSGPSSPEPDGFELAAIGIGSFVASWIFRRRKRPLLRHGSVWITVILAIAASGGALQAQQIYYSGSPVTGLVLVRTVNIQQQLLAASTAASASPVSETKPKMPPPRLRPPVIPTLLNTRTTGTAEVLTVVPASGLTAFNALSHTDQRLADNGNQWSIEPPNQSIAVSNGYVLEGVNDGVRIFNTSGSPSIATVASNQLFGLAPTIDRNTGINGVYLTDMRVYYDQGMDRWMVVQRSQDNDAAGNALNQSHLYIAVSQTADPTGTYYIYLMDTTNPNHPGCPCIDDYPQIGSDQYGFHIAWNEFSAPYLNFNDATILSISKASLASGASTPTAFQFFIAPTTGFEFAIQPAYTPPGASNFLASGGMEFFVSTFYQFGYGSQVALWAMYNTSSLATTSPNPGLTRITVNTLTYTNPDVATQRPGPLPYGSTLIPPGQLAYLDGGDIRVQALTYAGGRLYLTLQSGVVDQNGRGVVGGAYIVLSPTYRNGILAASVLNQGYLAVNSNHLLRPAIAVNAQGHGAIAATLVGPDWYPSAAVIPFDTFSTPSTIQVAAAGSLPEDGFTGYPGGSGAGVARWGDYNTAVVTSDGAIWMVVQYIGSYPRTQFANWNTLVIRKQP